MKVYKLSAQDKKELKEELKQEDEESYAEYLSRKKQMDAFIDDFKVKLDSPIVRSPGISGDVFDLRRDGNDGIYGFVLDFILGDIVKRFYNVEDYTPQQAVEIMEPVELKSSNMKKPVEKKRKMRKMEAKKRRPRCGVSKTSGRCVRGGQRTSYKCGVNISTRRCIKKTKPKAKKPGRKPNPWMTFLNANKKTYGYKKGDSWKEFLVRMAPIYQKQK